MAPFQIIANIPDIHIKAAGRDLPELFANCAHALQQILAFNPQEVKGAMPVRKISLKCENISELLAKFLNETISQSHSNSETYIKIHFPKLTFNELEAELRGHKITFFQDDLRAVKSSTCEICKKENGFEAVFAIDI